MCFPCRIYLKNTCFLAFDTYVRKNKEFVPKAFWVVNKLNAATIKLCVKQTFEKMTKFTKFVRVSAWENFRYQTLFESL